MYYKVKIIKSPEGNTPKAQQGKQVEGSLQIQSSAMGGADIDQYMGKPKTEVRDTLQPVPRDEANLEAEKGETALGDINGDGFPEHYKIGGKRHYQGGTPLNLPDDTFIFSDYVQMKIKDPDMLAKFGKSSPKGKNSKGYTPADLAKQYDINKYRKILQDPDSDSVEKKTAEIMIKNYNMKLGALALAQESNKGFPQGIPEVSKPFMEANGISEEQIMPKKQEQAAPEQMPSGEPVAMPEEMMMQQGQQPMSEEDMMAMQQQDPRQMQEMPMAMYGMSMGGYDMPFAQKGIETFDPYRQSQETIDKANEYFFERTKGIKLPSYYKPDPYFADMKAAEQLGISKEPWFNMGLSNQGLRDYYDTFKGNTWEPPHPVQTMSFEFEEGGQLDRYQQKGQVQPPYSEEDAYTSMGVERLNMYRRMYGLPQLSGTVTKEDIKKAAGEMQAKIIQENPELILDYMSRRTHKPNNQLLSILPKKYPKTTEGVRQAYEAGDLSGEQIRTAYKDDKWWYRALETDRKKLTREEYDKKMKEEGAIKQNDKLYFQDDADNAQLYTEYYTEDEEPLDPEVQETDEEKDVAERDPLVNPNFRPNPAAVAPEWMTPDVLNYYGTLKDKYSINKYLPWAPGIDLEEASPTYLDPTRELAAQSEQANILTQGLGQFVGPQALSARAASIQGQGAKQAADTLGRYNNANVGIENQFEQMNTNIRNQERAQNQAISKQLYDQNTFANQQFDNSMRQADAAKRLAFATGWKNASDLAAVNASSDQYDIDPVTGAIVFKGGKQQSPEISKDFNYWLDIYKSQGMNDKDAIAAAKISSGQGSNYYGPDRDTLMANLQQGGYVLGNSMYPFFYD
jgi:hypothetical protein